MQPKTRYTQNGEVSIAYQVVGEGNRDLVVIPGFISHVEQAWEEPAYARFLRRLASFSRLILLDKRGTGLSDRTNEIATLEQRMDDVRVVMDEAGSKQAALFGISEGGPMSILFAATYPERVSSLVLYGTMARVLKAPDYPWGDDPAELEEFLKQLPQMWGEPVGIDLWAPSVADDARFQQWWAKYLRMSSSPSAAINIFRMNALIDVREILPTVHQPTLILHRMGDRAVPLVHAQYLAEHMPNAKYVPLPGEDHLWWLGNSELMAGEIEEFVTGKRQTKELDRILATVMFTDIVDSTRQAAEMGDRSWQDLLASHHAIMQRQISQFRGNIIKNTGDGFLATFDGPARAIRCACTLRDEIRSLGIKIRAGLHTGEIDLVKDDIGGISVHIAARVLGKAANDEVLVSRTVKDLVVGSGIEFVESGTHRLKGVPEEWTLFAVP